MNLAVCNNQDLFWIVQLVVIAVRIICLAAPFALILFGSLDFFKAIIAGDEKEVKAKKKPFVGRVVAAVIILLMPTIINLVMKTLGNSEFGTCWTAAYQKGWSVTLPNLLGN